MAQPLVPGRGPLARVRPFAVFLVVAILFGVGIVVGGPVGAGVLGLLAVGVVVLLAVTWPRLTSRERLGRVLIIALLIAVAASVMVRGGLA